MARPPEWVLVPRIECRVATLNALFIVNDAGDEFWLPRSLVHPDSEVNDKFTHGDLIVAGWYAKQNSLDGDAYEAI